MSSGPSVRDVLCVLWSQCKGCVVCPLVPVEGCVVCPLVPVEGCVVCPLVPVLGMCCVSSGPSVRDVLCVLWSQCKGCVVCPLVPV